MAADWWAERLQKGDRQKFKDALMPFIERAVAENGSCYLQCDYDPMGPLLDAVRAAGLHCSGCMFSADGILPYKTSLWVRPDRLEPKEGYGNWPPPIKVPD
jgi:hypothetical protein